ncbi:hypothetical protein Ahy_A06g027099 isoform C [Arachis hypogaea]|uniref:Uncharacterized protein n=1 Tax=Arachis hypogaea TaxID=3818 RepID=A0A445CMN5_ARAHY|nr:hypothetical protein Ahy_A06g027099 isoform C [Arachis hypogaea]
MVLWCFPLKKGGGTWEGSEREERRENPTCRARIGWNNFENEHVAKRGHDSTGQVLAESLSGFSFHHCKEEEEEEEEAANKFSLLSNQNPSFELSFQITIPSFGFSLRFRSE